MELTTWLVGRADWWDGVRGIVWGRADGRAGLGAWLIRGIGPVWVWSRVIRGQG